MKSCWSALLTVGLSTPVVKLIYKIKLPCAVHWDIHYLYAFSWRGRMLEPIEGVWIFVSRGPLCLSTLLIFPSFPFFQSPQHLCFLPFILLLPSLPSPHSLLVAINYADSLTGWNKEIKHLNIVSWCMHSSPLPNTDIEEILHSSCQLTKL